MVSEKGWGFLRQDGGVGDAGIFFHFRNVVSDVELQNGDHVEFETQQSKRKPGSLEAVQVRLLSDNEPPTGAALATLFGDR